MSQTFELLRERDGGARLIVAIGGAELRGRYDADGYFIVERASIRPEKPQPESKANPFVPADALTADNRRATCEGCEHVKVLGRVTVTCGLCGCGGLRLDGPPNTCRANKW